MLDKYELYIYGASGKNEHLVTGHYVLWSKRDGYKASNALAVILAQQKEVIIYKNYLLKDIIEEVGIITT